MGNAPNLRKLSVLCVQDLIELRRNFWVARREVEGPRKIEQVHLDAKRDDANRARAAAGGTNMRGNRGGGDYRSGGGGLDSYGGPPQRYANPFRASGAFQT